MVLAVGGEGGFVQLTKTICDQAKYEGKFYDKQGKRLWSRYVLWDDEVPGLGLRITPRKGKPDRKTWVLSYRAAGQKRLFTLGDYSDFSVKEARQEATTQRSDVIKANRGDDGAVDPATRKERLQDADTFGELAKDYIENYAKDNKRSWKNDERMLGKDVLPKWKHKRVETITYRDVDVLLRAIVKRGAPVTANRVRMLLSKMFNHARIKPNPARDARKPLRKEKPRSQWLKDDEIRRMWDVLDGWAAAESGNRAKQAFIVGATYKLRLLTAQRGGEVRRMRWEDIDANRWWTIPGSVTKNGKSHRVYLSDPVVEILKRLHEINGESEWVFASSRAPRGGGERTHLGTLQTANQRLREQAKLEDFRPHDLRRTATTLMTSQCKVSLDDVGLVLNHSDPRLAAKTYNMYEYDDEKRRALEKLGHEVERILGAESDGNLLPFPVGS